LNEEHMDVPGTMDELEAWLATLDPIAAAKLLGVIGDRRNAGTIGAWRRKFVWEAAQEATHAEVAGQLGVTPNTVNKACIEHRRTLAE
jgi:hypothetical protein